MIHYLTHGYCGKGKAKQYHIHKSQHTYFPVGDKNHECYEEMFSRPDSCKRRIKEIASTKTIPVILYDGLNKIVLRD